MEHVIGPKRTLLIVGADEADVRDFVGSTRAFAVPRNLWPETERFETTGCTPDAVPGDRWFHGVIFTSRGAPLVRGFTLPLAPEGVTTWTWTERPDQHISGITCNHCGAALDPGDLPAAMVHEQACRPATRAVVKMARGSAPREVAP